MAMTSASYAEGRQFDPGQVHALWQPRYLMSGICFFPGTSADICDLVGPQEVWKVTAVGSNPRPCGLTLEASALNHSAKLSCCMRQSVWPRCLGASGLALCFLSLKWPGMASLAQSVRAWLLPSRSGVRASQGACVAFSQHT